MIPCPGRCNSCTVSTRRYNRYIERGGATCPRHRLTMDVRKINDNVSIIDFKGKLTAFAEGVIYNQASDGRVRTIILNFEGLEYMNSSGIVLLFLNDTATTESNTLSLHDAPP